MSKLDETSGLILLHIARHTGQKGRAGFSGDAVHLGFVPFPSKASEVIDKLLERGLVVKTPARYLCVTVQGCDALRLGGLL